VKRLNKTNASLTAFEAHPLVLFCVFITVSIAITVVMTFLHGVEFILNIHWIIAMSIFCAAPVIAIVLLERIPPLQRFDDDACSLWISIPVHFVISVAIVLLGVFIWRFFEDMPAIAFRNAVLTFLQGYSIIAIGAIIIDSRKTAAANKNLKKIRESQIIDGGKYHDTN